MNELLAPGILAGLFLAVVLTVLVRINKLDVALPVLSWAVPITFGLMYILERPLGNAFGLVLIIPFVLLPLVGLALATTGLVLAFHRRGRPKRAILIGAVAALTPVAAMLIG